MNHEFRELDPPSQILFGGRWYVGVKPSQCEYLQRDLKLHSETGNGGNDFANYAGLWEYEFAALSVSRDYYILHCQPFPYEDRYQELTGNATTNTSLCESQPMVFK